MAAENKTDLLDIHRKEFTKLANLMDSLSADVALLKDEEDTSIKDVVTHRAHWIGLFLGWYADGLEGKPVFFPAEGYKWNELKRYNAELRVQQADLNWPDAVQELHNKHSELTGFLERCSNEDLYGGPMKGANNQWTPGRWAEAAGPSHFSRTVAVAAAVLRSAARRRVAARARSLDHDCHNRHGRGLRCWRQTVCVTGAGGHCWQMHCPIVQLPHAGQIPALLMSKRQDAMKVVVSLSMLIEVLGREN